MRGGWVAIGVALLVALAFLPRSLANHDEFYYAGQAYTLAHGRLAPQPGDPLLVGLNSAAEAFRYPVAWPAVLSLARLVSFRAMFVVALLCHLAAGAAVARMLVRRKVPSFLAVAYLFHPVFWIYSRTLLSDGPTAAALLLAMDGWENRSRVATSGWLGLMSGVRLANGIAACGFGFSIINRLRRRLSDVVALIIGTSLFVGIQLLVNRRLDGHWLVSSYAVSGAKMFDGAMTLENVVLYLGGLALLPPFCLVFAVARPRSVDRWALIAIPILIAYVPISFHNVSANVLETLVGGQRYLMPAHAALLVATARSWSRLPFLTRPVIPLVLGAAVAVIGCLAMRPIERRHGAAAGLVVECRPKAIGYTRHANMVAGSVPADSYDAFDLIPETHRPWDVMVLTPGYQGNQPGFATPWQAPPPAIPGATCQVLGPYAVYDFTGRCPVRGAPCSGSSSLR